MAFTKITRLFVPVFCLLFVACSQPADETVTTTQAGVASAEAAIAIPEPYAAEIAVQVLKKGGNAVDAAVATGFALAVTYIDAGNVGGGGFMLLQMDGEASFLDYREKAALAAHRERFPAPLQVCGRHISATASYPGKMSFYPRPSWLRTAFFPPKFSLMTFAITMSSFVIAPTSVNTLERSARQSYLSSRSSLLPCGASPSPVMTSSTGEELPN
jgi:hypothetical protein